MGPKRGRRGLPGGDSARGAVARGGREDARGPVCRLLGVPAARGLLALVDGPGRARNPVTLQSAAGQRRCRRGGWGEGRARAPRLPAAGRWGSPKFQV